MKLKIIASAVMFPLLWLAAVSAENLPKSKHFTEYRECKTCNVPAQFSKQLSPIDSLIQSGIQQRRSGNYQQSIATLEQALKLAQQSGNLDGEWQARTFLALTYKIAGNLQKAAELHEQNLVFVRKHPNELASEPMNRETASLEALSGVYTSQKNYAKAIELLREELKIVETKDTNTGSLAKPKIIQKLGVNLFLSGNVKEAEKTLLAAFEAYENARLFRLNAGMPAIGEYEFEVEVLRWLQQVLVTQNRTDEALELAERGRSRAFVGLLASRLANNSRLQINVDSPNINQIKQIAKAQNSTLVEYTVTYEYDPDLPLQFSNYRDIRATGLLIWVVKPTGEIGFRQVKLEQNNALLGELVQNARNSIGARGRGFAIIASAETQNTSVNNKKLQQLHQILIDPIAQQLPTDQNARITFIPQDLLFLVPFAALQDSAGKYLIEKHTIITAPSIQVLDLTRQQQQRIQEVAKGVLVVGNPTMPSLSQEGGSPEQLPSLPGAEREAKAIAQLFNSQAIIGNDATKATVEQRMSQARIIHLATHGILDDVGGVFSSLAFAPASGDNGFLNAREILALKLNAELVVLSACDTGKGKITGDGVVGLSRSFISAGIPSIIVSLWSVPDSPTAQLMTAFYQNLKNGSDKAQALRIAMLQTMKQFPNPRDWAAFTLIGEADTSKTLATVMGDSSSGSGNSVQATASRYTVFPLPDNVKNYTEFPSRFVQGEVDVFFTSNLSAEELIKFYRQAFIQKGLTERSNLARIDETGFQLVFYGSPNGHPITIQGSSVGTDYRTVSIRFEEK
ncbi:CHAT domain-containing protein [Argonema antarcticum]|uniref:CHAT domain-containing protein n=1 Tax=Argonema antarcticum TaxID=2942763 RepID=UPI002012AC3C|nr:CHAT domain-containing tetratricopeptide repeat protein [Argonema antarcticum]MCL1469601.1 CHAT domain-containing protein [Argonema antarcticum A004/B2]